ncbi:MAG: ADP-ribosylation factor-like protein [Candidatus Njordarchaeota archaeon]
MVNVVFVGLDNAGKTSIKLFLQYLDKEKALSTVTSTSIEKFARAGLGISVIPGQKIYREDERFYKILFPSADHIVLVVDATRPDRFEEVKEYYAFIKKMMKKYCLKKTKITILAHKQDIKNAKDSETVKKAIAGIRSKTMVLETSIHDLMSMIILLKNLYGDLKGNDIDFITQALQDRLKAEGVALYDSQKLPLSIAGNKDLLSKISNKYFDALLRDDDFHYGIISTNGSNIAMACERVNGYSITLIATNFKVGIEEVLSIIREATSCYAKEFMKRWGNEENPWNF